MKSRLLGYVLSFRDNPSTTAMKSRLLGYVLSFRNNPSRSFSNGRLIQAAFKPSYWHNPGQEPLSSLTIGQLVSQAANKYGDREAVVSVHQNHRITFSEMESQVDKLAAGLLEMGLQKGDRVGLWSPNCSEWYIASCAVAKAGLILVNINPAYQTSEIEYCLRKVGVKALIMASYFKSQNYYQLLLNIMPEMKTSSPGQINSEKLPMFKSLVIISDDKFEGSFRYKDVLEYGSSSSIQRLNELENDIQADDGWNIQFSSGTTGSPKAILLSHHNTVNNARGTGKRNELNKKHQRVCLPVPLFHCFGGIVGLLASIHYGATVVLPGPQFKAMEVLKAIEQERCTVVFGTPTMYVDLISAVKQSKIHPTTLEMVLTSGSPCSEHLCYEMHNVLKVKRIGSVFGMTETSPVTFQLFPSDSLEQSATTLGYPSDHLEVKVVDPDGKIVPLGTPGELCIRGYVNMLGYWEDEVNTKKTIGSDRWLKTGDQFVLLDNGYGQVVGRLKDMIIRGGENIFPREIEDFLQTHQDVLEAQVFGVPDYRMGEEVCCCLTVKNGAALTEQDLREYCKGKISHFKVPKYFRFVDEFPKTTSGKIQKFKLRNDVLKEMNISS